MVPKPCKPEIKQRSVDGKDQEQRAFREKKHFPSLPGLRKPLSKCQKWGISLVYSPLLLILRLMFPEPGKYCRKFHISTFLVTFSYLTAFGTQVEPLIPDVGCIKDSVLQRSNLKELVAQFSCSKYLNIIKKHFLNLLIDLLLHPFPFKEC